MPSRFISAFVCALLVVRTVIAFISRHGFVPFAWYRIALGVVMLVVLLVLAVVTIVFSACAAFAQRDLKRILAYSSINHLGYCLLAIFAVAMSSPSVARARVRR